MNPIESVSYAFDDSFLSMHFCSMHFIAWLDANTEDSIEWIDVHSAICNLLYDDPDLINDHSWSELRRLAGV